MKYLFSLLLFSLFSLKGYSQLSYSDLSDLNIICKKGDFEAAKVFLKTKDYSIEVFKSDYDHGSYFVLGELEAKKKIGNRYQKYLIGTDFDNIYDEIEIKFYEYNDKKELEITQHYSTNNALHVSYTKLAPIYQWITKKWTSVLIDDYDMANEIFPDKKDRSISLGSYYGGIDNELNNIDEKLLSSYFYNHKFKETETFRIIFRNENLNYGDWTNYNVSYEYTNFSKDSTYEEAKNKSYVYYITLNTLFAKGDNLINKVEKKITFPLIKEGKTYSIKLRFGNINKKYILDSGASDMSIDTETFQYLNSANQLKIENRLSDANYQLADGSIVNFKRVRIPSFSINNITVNNIDATIVQNGKPLLLGKSFLDSFKSWKIDNESHSLIVELF